MQQPRKLIGVSQCFWLHSGLPFYLLQMFSGCNPFVVGLIEVKLVFSPFEEVGH
jgi:hypothetical protein